MSNRLAQFLSHQISRKSLRISSRRFGFSPILKDKIQKDYNNDSYWLKNINENKYAFGITEKFMEQNGYPQMIFFEAEIDDILMEGDSFAVIENEKMVVALEAPFDNARLVCLDEDIDFDIVNDDPLNLENKICVFEDVNTPENTNSEGGNDGVIIKMSML